MSKTKLIVIFGLVLALVVTMSILPGCKKAEEATAPAEEVTEAEEVPVEEAVEVGKQVRNEETGDLEWEGPIPFEPCKEGEECKVGQMVLTAAHEYQVRRQISGREAAEELGVTLLQDSAEMDANKLLSTVENWIQEGVKAIAFTQTDAGTGVAVAELCMQNGVAIVMEVEPNPDVSYPWPLLSVTESDHNAFPGGVFAAEEFNRRWGEDAKAIVASLTLSVYKVCDMRNNSFEEGFISIHPNTEVINEEGGGMREPGMKAMETLLQAHPDINVLFGCNDDSTLGGMGAAIAAGKTKDDIIVIGYDGTLAAFEEVKDPDSPLIADVAQDPEADGYWEVKIAAETALGIAEPGDYPHHNFVNLTYLVTLENVDEYIELAKKGQPARSEE